MPGRKNPEMTESERTREYRLMQKRGYGEAGEVEGAEVLEHGPAHEIAQEREEWASEHEQRRRDG